MPSDAKACPVCGLRYDAAAVFCQRDGARLARAPEPETGAPQPDADALVGRVLLDQFRVDAVIGAGGMGTVYRARQLGVDRDVAIKILHGDVAQDPEAARRFEREARVSAQIDHPNVVRVLLFGRLPDRRCYLVMEHLVGPSLADVLADAAGPLPPSIAATIVAAIADGLGAAHRAGVVHRDVKPENVILVDGDPTHVKILDFGVARCLWGEHTMATEAGLVFGTARYISPEGASGDRTDARSDVYSLGVLAHHMLAGRPPFDAETPVAMLLRHVQDPAPPLPMSLPRSLREVVARSLEKSPDRRPRDGDDLARQIRAAARDAGWSMPPSLGDRASTPPPPAAGQSAVPPGRGPGAVPTLLEARRDALLGAPSIAGDAAPPVPFHLPDPPGAWVSPATDAGARGVPAGSGEPPPGLVVPPVATAVPARGPGSALGRLAVLAVAFALGAGAVVLAATQLGLFAGGDAAALRSREAPAGTLVAGAPRAASAAPRPTPSPTSPAPGVHVEPRSPVAGDPVTLVAVVDPALPLGDPPEARFRLFRRGRTVGDPIAASRMPGSGFVASTRFRRAGVHRIEFQVRVARPGRAVDERVSLSVDVEVRPPDRPGVAHRREPHRTVTNPLPSGRVPAAPPAPTNVTRRDGAGSPEAPATEPLPPFPFRGAPARDEEPAKDEEAPDPEPVTPWVPPGAELL